MLEFEHSQLAACSLNLFNAGTKTRNSPIVGFQDFDSMFDGAPGFRQVKKYGIDLKKISNYQMKNPQLQKGKDNACKISLSNACKNSSYLTKVFILLITFVSVNYVRSDFGLH